MYILQVASLAKLQEELSEQKVKELSLLKERLLSEKKTAVTRVEHRIAEQAAKFQQQLVKVREQSREEVATLEEEMTRQLADEREKSEQLRESLSVAKKVSEMMTG